MAISEAVVIVMVMAAMLGVPALIVLVVVLATRRRNGPSTPYPAELIPAGAQHAATAGFFADPSGRNEQHYWDGSAWTDAVLSNGQPGTDPV